MDKLSGVRIKRSRFNLSHRKIFDAGYYNLIPILYYFGNKFTRFNKFTTKHRTAIFPSYP